MNIKPFIYSGVAQDGRTSSGGLVDVHGSISKSAPGGGCGNDGCECSPGHWICITNPRTESGAVLGYTVFFGTRRKLEAANLSLIDQHARRMLVKMLPPRSPCLTP